MNGHQQACFSPYMLISSTLQSVFGYDRRKEQDKQADIASPKYGIVPWGVYAGICRKKIFPQIGA